MDYRADEGAVQGRLGDPEESRLREVFRSRSNFFSDADIEGLRLTNCTFDGFSQHVVVETVVNDFCSCSSIGTFDPTRGQFLRDREQQEEKKPGAYVTYHVPTLMKALSNRLKADGWSNLELFGRVVEYGKKDRHWSVESKFTYTRDADALAVWLGIAFIKSKVFSHEEEFRILAIDRSKPGDLDASAKPLGHVDKWRTQRRIDVISMKPRKLSAVLS
ncbi:MAG: hypothetical protein EpisKO_03940 [Epibacterium sp.]